MDPVKEALQAENGRLNTLLEQKDREIRDLTAKNDGLVLQIEALRQQISIDPLTQLYTRSHADRSLQGFLRPDRREPKSQAAALVLIDIDYFKYINDTYGHPVGDEVLEQVGALLLDHTRQTDVPTRFGGDELGIIFFNINPNALGAKVESIREAIQKITFEEHPNLEVTASFGTVIIDRSLSLAENKKRADTALYESKNKGRNKVTDYSEL